MADQMHITRQKYPTPKLNRTGYTPSQLNQGLIQNHGKRILQHEFPAIEAFPYTFPQSTLRHGPGYWFHPAVNKLLNIELIGVKLIITFHSAVTDKAHTSLSGVSIIPGSSTVAGSSHSEVLTLSHLN